MTSPNKAVAKIGFELRNRYGDEKPEIKWRGRQDFFHCGVNIPAQAATLSLNRSALEELTSHLPETNRWHGIFQDLVDILDEENQNVNAELDATTASVNEKLNELQS
jgi:hypothetical protein